MRVRRARRWDRILDRVDRPGILSQSVRLKARVERHGGGEGWSISDDREGALVVGCAEKIQAGFQGMRGLSFDERWAGRIGGEEGAWRGTVSTLPISSTR
jgi:hypothetical protein